MIGVILKKNHKSFANDDLFDELMGGEAADSIDVISRLNQRALVAKLLKLSRQAGSLVA